MAPIMPRSPHGRSPDDPIAIRLQKAIMEGWPLKMADVNSSDDRRVAPPDNVPPTHIVDFDYLHPDLGDGDIYAAFGRLHAGPDILWTPRNGGHWILTRAEDVRWAQESHALFSTTEMFIPRGLVSVSMPPQTVDPPLHSRFRAILNPFFTPSRVAGMADRARQLSIELIEGLRPQGGCDFVREFAQVMPIEMFLTIVDLPLSRREQFVEWGVGFVSATNQHTRARYLEPIDAYLRRCIDERYQQPGPDLLSKIALWRDNSRFGGEHEVIGMALLLFFGGLDTVANLLSFIAWHLAEHPACRHRLREDPSVIPQASEEYIRRFGLSNTGRLIRQNVQRKGVHMRAGEMLMVPLGASSVDERAYSNPFLVDFDRPLVSVRDEADHNSFGHGAHKCVGRPLARMELRIFLEEWLRLIPDFSLAPSVRPRTRMGSINGVENLRLIWPLST